jgi:hypothetical protein
MFCAYALNFGERANSHEDVCVVIASAERPRRERRSVLLDPFALFPKKGRERHEAPRNPFALNLTHVKWVRG